jgi:hypothetical protein
MYTYCGGRAVEIPADADGNIDVEELRKRMDIPNDRVLVQQQSSGRNMVVPRSGSIKVNPSDHFLDGPRSVRG